jgi:protein-S-isoprenylcysteine O-methyltransferase Ste14
MGARVFVWLGGALFAASLAVSALTYLIVLGRPTPFAGWLPVAADTALITIFALHHSLFARERVKDAIARRFPPPLIRSLYVWIASVLLLLVCALWRTVGDDLYRASGILALALTVIQIAGFLIIASAVARIDPLELAGIRPARQVEGLQIVGPYRWVRHPLYFGWLLMVFGAAHMTGDRLAFAVLTTLYLVVAIPLEERSLRRIFGDDYTRYMRLVRWRMIPFIY